MHWRLTQRLVLLGAICATLSPTAIDAQMPPRLKKCLPFPTLADEIKDMQKRVEVEEEASYPKIRFDAVTFEGATHLPESIRAQITGRLDQTGFDNHSPWIDISRETVMDALQQYGYLFAKVSAEARILSSDPTEELVSVTFRVTEGPQYRLGEIQFANARVFPPWYLRKQFALQDGDVFDLQKIREGIDALTWTYGSQGYINFTAAPDLQVDNSHQRISVLMELEEDKQYRVGSVEVLRLGREISGHPLKMKLKPGDVFNPKLIEDFYNENKSVLPPDVSPSEDTQMAQNPREGTVEIVFDVRDCL
jgi:outer membrane protein assembly factor BamA